MTRIAFNLLSFTLCNVFINIKYETCMMIFLPSLVFVNNKYEAIKCFLFAEWFRFCNIRQNWNDRIALHRPFIRRVWNGNYQEWWKAACFQTLCIMKVWQKWILKRIRKKYELTYFSSLSQHQLSIYIVDWRKTASFSTGFLIRTYSWSWIQHLLCTVNKRADLLS